MLLQVTRTRRGSRIGGGGRKEGGRGRGGKKAIDLALRERVHLSPVVVVVVSDAAAPAAAPRKP